MPIQQLFGSSQPFGINIVKELIFNKKWLILEIDWNVWSLDIKSLDLFDCFTSDELDQLRTSPNTFFMFSFLWEGNSYKEYNYYELISAAGIKHNIPPEKLFFISSNILEEQSFDDWQKVKYPDYKINVISFSYFAWSSTNFVKPVSIDQTVANIKNNPKFFISLNRRIRALRTYTIYKIFTSRIKDNTLLSFPKLEPADLIISRVNSDAFFQVCQSSPSILDVSDFETNWATHPPNAASPNELYKNSMISLVSESLFRTCENTSLFYTEKTFKPMLYNHPLIIFGQAGLNTSLNKIGFKYYNKHFDLSFDTIDDHHDRIDAQIHQIEKLNDQLLSMTVGQKIDWILQDMETMEHNKQALIDQKFNRSKLQKLIELTNT